MWEFATNEDGSLDGWNDGDIANFKSNVFKNLAREIIQNSIDARYDENSPVIVTFELQTLPRICIPGLDTIKDHMEYIQENSAHTEGDTYKKEIIETLNYSRKSSLPVLVISDENTYGMPDTEQKDSVPPFLKYMKSKGSSGGDQNRAGSHGIGKAAPLATTPLRTIYVGTRWKGKSEDKTLYQGRARLMYRKVKENGNIKIKSGTGYWGAENFQPLKQLDDERFKWLRRETRGTTIGIPGFRTKADRDWMPIIAGYVVSDFFAAIQRGALEVRLKDPAEKALPELIINKEKIKNRKTYFQNKEIIKQIEKHTGNEVPELNEAFYYHQCLLDDDKVKELEHKILNKFDIKLRVIIEEGAPRKVCFIRKNMKITDYLKQGQKNSFWAPGQAPKATIKDFVGVVEILDEKGNNLFRSMEPAQHNALEIDNMPQEDRDLGRDAFRALSKWLREKIVEIASEEAVDNRSVSELTEFFYDDSDNDPSSAAKTKEENINGGFVYKRKPMAKQIPPRKQVIAEDGEDNVGGGSGGNGGDGGGGGGGSGHGTGKGGTGEKKSKNQNIKLPHQRIVKTKIGYSVTFSMTKITDCIISILEVGLDSDYTIKVASSDFGELQSDGKIKISKLDFKDELKKTFNIRLSEAVQGGLEVLASKSE